MAYTIILHMLNEDPIVAQVEDLPESTATNLICTEIRRRDGKPVHFLSHGVNTVIFPVHRLHFVEVLTSETERGEVLEFFRD